MKEVGDDVPLSDLFVSVYRNPISMGGGVQLSITLTEGEVLKRQSVIIPDIKMKDLRGEELKTIHWRKLYPGEQWEEVSR